MGVVTSDRALRVPPALTGAPLVRTDDAGVAAGALHDLLGRGVVAPHDARERLDLVVAARRFGLAGVVIERARARSPHTRHDPRKQPPPPRQAPHRPHQRQ